MESMPSMAMEEENIIIHIEDDSDDEDNNNELENNDNDENEGNNNEQENYEDDDGEGSNDEVNDENDDDQENNENGDYDEGNDDEEENNDDDNEAENGCENEKNENDVCEDNNSEESDASSNDGETESSDIEDSQRVNVEANNQQHIETRVDMEYIPQAKNGPNCMKRSTARNEILQSSNAHTKQNCKKWKGKGKLTNTNDGVKVQEPYHKQGHKAYNKSGACRKDVANVKSLPNTKSPDATGGSLKNVNSSLQQNDSNSKGESINKGGNSQVWKNTNNSNSNKKNNSSNSIKSSSGSDNKYGNSNESNNKGKVNPNNKTLNNNNNKNNNDNNNNNNKNQNNSNNKNNSNNNKNQNNNNKNNNNNKQKGEQPLRNLLKEIKEVMDSILKKKFSIYPLDSSILKLHYRLTVLLFVVLYTMIQACWIWKESIFCVYGHNADATTSYYIKNFCLTYPFVYEDQMDGKSQRRYILFYRWTHLSFLFLSSLFYIPRVFVKFFNNPRVKQLLHDLARGEHQYDTSKWEQDTNMMVQYMNNHASTHGYLYFWLIICHMVALVIDLAVVLYFDYVLQGHFRNLVYSAYPLHRDPQFFTDYLSRMFPPFVRCRLEKQILINNEREEELGCHLLLMDVYDKMFVVIWLWLVFLIFCTTIKVLALLLLVMPPFNRLFLNIQTDSKDMKKIRNKIVKKYCATDLFVLYLMKCHRSESQFCMLLSELIHSEESSDMLLALSKKKSKVSFKDEMMSKTGHLQESPPSSQEEQWCTKKTLHYSPIFPHDEMLRNRRINSSTPCPDYDADISFPRNFMKNEYKV